MDLMKALTSQYMKQELPEVQVGDTVRVHVKIKEGSRERIQIFEGTVIAKKHGGIEETITVRRISYGVGCEKVFPLHAPNVVNVECVRHGKVRRAKLYYLRDRLGKAAKVKELLGVIKDHRKIIQGYVNKHHEAAKRNEILSRGELFNSFVKDTSAVSNMKLALFKELRKYCADSGYMGKR